MATLIECCEKREWWLNELRSLGIEVNKTNELNDVREISVLVSNIKRYYSLYYRNSSRYSLRGID